MTSQERERPRARAAVVDPLLLRSVVITALLLSALLAAMTQPLGG